MKEKIIEHYKLNFSSSPVEVDSNEIDFIIKHNCECYRCGDSIFEMDDFPELLIDDGEIMCGDCYDENYRQICPVCEESYDTKEGEPDYFVIVEEDEREIRNKAGIYQILKRPFFFGNILTGFESFFDDSIKLIIPIKINEYKKISCGEGCCEVSSGMICDDCVDKYVRKGNYIKSDGTPCILIKKYDTEIFSDYSPERLNLVRQKLIHERITCRGIIETANRVTI